ncbi:MAG: hypothetical protein ASARMPREDX12_001803 [Alectoria sarmentosa]|nr:MAG: hypothetical protein ASARMPREDX12_001803 [Alectoria sarmentosa]
MTDTLAVGQKWVHGRDNRTVVDNSFADAADQTSYINYIKPLILAEELQLPYVISVIDTNDEWYYKIHPERYVPALRDEDPDTKQQVNVFESTACLQYLTDRFDDNGFWQGRTAWEKAAVLSWTAYQTAGLGATAKYWLYFLKGYPSRQSPEPLPKTVANVLTRPEDVRTVFKDSDQHLKAVNNNAGWLMGEILGSCVGLISGSEWQTLRTVTEGPFLHKEAANHISRIELRTKKHFHYLHMQGKLDQGLINPVDDLKFLPFWIVADIVYGELSPEMEAKLKQIIPVRESLFRRMIAGTLSRFQVSRYLPTATNRELCEFKEKWAAFNNKAYHHSLADGSDTLLVQMYREAQKDRISLDKMYQTLDEMLFANLDVTVGGISWNLLFLGGLQDSQTHLRTEIVTKRRDTQGAQNDWKGYLLSSSTLLAASILESARLRPLAAFSVPQATPTDRTLGGFVVPAGTNFVVDAYALNVRNPYWGDNSTEYRPKRFLERGPTETRYHYWRFGFGPRTCMGKYVADLILKIILAHLIENYRLSLVGNGNDWDRNPKTWITHPNTDIKCERIM